eukprot:927434-Pelagomonas_calceolata.AAC.1
MLAKSNESSSLWLSVVSQAFQGTSGAKYSAGSQQQPLERPSDPVRNKAGEGSGHPMWVDQLDLEHPKQLQDELSPPTLLAIKFPP